MPKIVALVRVSTDKQDVNNQKFAIEKKYPGYDIEWFGEGEDELGIEKKTKKTIVRVDSKYYRPSEVDTLLGDSTKARKELGWKPKISFKDLVEDMCKNGK